MTGLTSGLVSQLLANYISICSTPAIITYSAPGMVDADLHPSFKRSRTIHQSHITIRAVGVGRSWNWNHNNCKSTLERMTVWWNAYVPGHITEASLDVRQEPSLVVLQLSTLLSLPLHWRPRTRVGSSYSMYQLMIASAPIKMRTKMAHL